MRQLPCSVRTEVHVDDHVTGGNGRRAVQHRWRDELVALPPFVRGGHGLTGRSGAKSSAVHDRVVREPGAVPPAVAIHGEVAAADGGDARFAIETRLQPWEEPVGGAGWGVATIGECVEENPVGRESRPMRQLHHGHDVLVDGVDSPRADETHEMQPATAGRHLAACGDERLVLEEGPVRDRGADTGKVLENPEAGTEVEMPDLAV